MRRVWAAVLASWALFGLIAVLAWARPATAPLHSSVVVVHTAHGLRTVVHTTTRTSPAAAAQQQQVVSSPNVAVQPAGAGG